MSEEYNTNSQELVHSPEFEEKWHEVVKAIEVAISKAEYFKQEHKSISEKGTLESTGITEGDYLIHSLESAYKEFTDTDKEELLRVPLFGGAQSRNMKFPEEAEKNLAVEHLFNEITTAVGVKRPTDYYKIQEFAKSARSKVKSEPDNHEFGSERFSAIVNESGEVFGLQIKVSENIYVNFELGNFGDPSNPGEKMTLVNLFLAPQSR